MRQPRVCSARSFVHLAAGPLQGQTHETAHDAGSGARSTADRPVTLSVDTMAGVTDQYDRWFDPRVFPDAPDELSDAELAFTGGMRDVMAGCWNIPDVGREDDGHLLVTVHITVWDDGHDVWRGAAEYGVSFDGVSAEADKVNGHAGALMWSRRQSAAPSPGHPPTWARSRANGSCAGRSGRSSAGIGWAGAKLPIVTGRSRIPARSSATVPAARPAGGCTRSSGASPTGSPKPAPCTRPAASAPAPARKASRPTRILRAAYFTMLIPPKSITSDFEAVRHLGRGALPWLPGGGERQQRPAGPSGAAALLMVDR